MKKKTVENVMFYRQVSFQDVNSIALLEVGVTHYTQHHQYHCYIKFLMRELSYGRRHHFIT